MPNVGGRRPRPTSGQRRHPRTDAASAGRLLFIDACLNRRVASELRSRGRAAVSAAQAELADVDDATLLRAIAERDELAVVVTSDDRMPWEWSTLISELGSTIATVAPRRGREAVIYETEEQWERDTVHRWAHAMQVQARGTIRRYSPVASRPWRER